MILNDDVGMLCLDGFRQLSEHGRLTDTGHILQADFLGTGSNHLVGNSAIILHRVNGRSGDAERGLRNHACRLGPFDGGNDIACIVQTAEDARNIDTLSFLHLIHQLAHVIGYRIHAQGIQATVEHVGLYAHLVEWLTEGANGIIRILACHEVHLFESAAVGLYTGKAPHINDDGSNALQLILARLKLSA